MNTSANPKVTVVLPTYNRPQYLAEAINSVVGQTFQNWELIVLNDGGVDVADVVAKFADPRIIYCPDTANYGSAKRCNQGMNMARGEYVTYLDDDDIYYPNHVEVLAKALDENPGVALVYSDLYATASISERESGKRYTLDKRIDVSRDFNRQFMFHYNHVLHVSLMHRVEAGKRVGGYDEKVKVLIEWGLNRRLCFCYDFLHVGVATGEYNMPIFKSDRISVRERRNSESYKHNLRKIRTSFPPEPWNKIDRVDLIYVVDEWGPKLNQHLEEIIDNFDHPFYIYLVNNGTGRTMKEIRTSLDKLTELKSINIVNLKQKMNPIAATRMAAKKSNADYFFLVTPELAATTHPRRLFSTLEFLKNNPEYQAVRWDVKAEAGTRFNLLITRDYFMKCSRPGKSHMVNIQAVNMAMPKGFQFDAVYASFNKAVKEKNYEKAYALMKEIFAIDGGAPPIQYLINQYAPLLMKLKKYDELEKELRELIARGFRPDNLLRLGILLSKTGRLPEAVATLQDALRAYNIDEKTFDADCFPFSLGRKLAVFEILMTLGESYLELGDLGKGAHNFRHAVKLRSNGHEPILGFAKVWFQSGQYDRAEAALQKLPGRGGKEDPDTHLLLGKLCQKRKELDLAFGCFQKALELEPCDEKVMDPYYFTGTALAKWEEMYEALIVFHKQFPEHVQTLARLSAVCYQLKSDAVAEEMAKRCLELEPNQAMAKSILGRLKSRKDVSLPEGELSGAMVEIGGQNIKLDNQPLAW